VLEQAVCEAAGRGAHVDAGEARRVYPKFGERLLKLQPAAPDVARRGVVAAAHAQGRVRREGLGGLLHAPLAGQHATRHHERLRPRPRRRQPLLHQQPVHTLALHGVNFRS
jgi:hypothetical protein